MTADCSGLHPPARAGALVDVIRAPEAVRRSLPDIAGTALRAMRVYLDMEVAFVAEFVEDQRVFRYVDAGARSPVEVGGADPLEESYCQRVVDGRLPELIHDAAALPAAAELPVTADLPVGAHVSVPIRLSDGGIYGTFCCFSSTPDRSLTERDLAMMRVFAAMIAESIEVEIAAEQKRERLQAELRGVLGGAGLSMVYQPIFDLTASRAVGYEALARFADGRGPDVWFARASEAGMAAELELAAIEAALLALPRLPAGAYLAVNASPASIASGLLPRALHDAPLDRIVIEVTEHEAVATYDGLTEMLRPLRAEGLRLAVDDAGAGYASFRHILRLEPDYIKLDMTITRDVHSDPARRALATALLAFARETGSRIIAEGVETDAELQTLQSLGIDRAQGYLLGRPAPLPATRQPWEAVDRAFQRDGRATRMTRQTRRKARGRH